MERSGDREAANETAARALEDARNALGPGHPLSLALANGLASTRMAEGDYAAAKALLAPALEEAVRLYGPGHPLAAAAAANLGEASMGLGDLEESTFFFKLAAEASGDALPRLPALDEGVRRSLAKAMERPWHSLFDALAKAGRTEEALEALDLLKADEFAALDPGHSPNGPYGGQPAADLFSGTPEAGARRAYAAVADAAAAAGRERAALDDAAAAEGGLSPESSARAGELDAAAAETKAAFLDFLERLPSLLGEGGAPAAPTSGSMSRRLEALAAAGAGAAMVHAVSADRALYLVMVAPGFVSAGEAAISNWELVRLVAEFRALLEDASKDPRPAAKRLYDAVIGPLEADLEACGAETLMLSLDGALRYAPAAAFWDGERWLAEKYPTAIFTETTASRLRDPPPSAGASARAMGVTAAWPGFPALSGVREEIASVVKSRQPEGAPAAGGAAVAGAEGGAPAPGGEPYGALDGEAFLDAAFTRRALSESVASEAQAVHVASHLRLDPAGHDNTELLLGNGRTISLGAIESAPDLDLKGIDLLAFSASDTASGFRRGRGAEVESFGEALQRSGATAVLASLWTVSDLSTAKLVREFYRLRYSEGKDKAEALRGAQLAVMRDAAAQAAAAGSPAPRAGGEQERAGALTGNAPRWDGKGYSHPYYWAHFIVIGNWR
jgi:pentatricopeptide repeat protein